MTQNLADSYNSLRSTTMNPLAKVYARLMQPVVRSSPYIEASRRLKGFGGSESYNPMLEAIYERAMSQSVTPNVGGEIVKNIFGTIIGSKLGETNMAYLKSELKRERKQKIADEKEMLDYRAGLEAKTAEDKATSEYRRQIGLAGAKAGLDAGQNYLDPAKYAPTPRQAGNLKGLISALPQIESYQEAAKTNPEIYTEAVQNALKNPDTGLPDISLASKYQEVQGGLYDVNNNAWKVPPKAEKTEGQGFTLKNKETGVIQYRRLNSGESIPEGWEIYQAPLRGSIRQLGLDLGSMPTSELIALKKSYEPDLMKGYEGDTESSLFIDR